MARSYYKHPIKFIKISYTRDECGSQIKIDGDEINTKCRILSNFKNRNNENGDINYLSQKQIEINSYVNINGYDEFELCGKRYRIISMTQNEDYFVKSITAEEINT